jgi:DNA gyrase/topoisomerase IV subunit B
MSKEQFQILSPREHVRMRIGMYMGSSSIEEVDRFIMGKWQTVRYVPALSKMVDEIIDNSIDEAIRTNFKYADKIDVSVNGNTVTVTDNGRGIPQEEIVDTDGQKILRPVAAWTRVNAGTSFDDGRVTIGANGVGSACTNFLSNRFTGRTWQNGKLVEVHCTDGGLNIDVKIKKLSGNGTEVSFEPDFALLEANSLSDLDTVSLIEDRLTSLQMAFPEIKFTFNGRKVSASNMKAYSSMFVSNENATVLTTQSENVSFFFAASEDGFRSNSFVNGVNTRQGGSYVDFIVNSVVDELVSMVKRKHKIEVAKSTIKNGLTFVLFARKFANPKFDSQTKERLTSTMGSVKQHYEESGSPDFTYLARKIMASNDIIDPIIEAQLAKKLAADKRSATLEQKKLKKVKVAKHIAANKSGQGTLFLMEGLSALGFFLKVRDTDFAGAYPLRGVVMNTWDMKPGEVLKNKELSELVAVLGLDINDPDSVSNMNYKNIATLSDADVDGAKIATLIVAFFYKFWPRLLTEGRVGVTRSPIMISTNGKDEKWFFNYAEAKKFKETAKGYNHRYLKGLGSLTESEYDRVINKPVLDIIYPDKPALFEMMFGADSSSRKEFMMR